MSQTVSRHHRHPRHGRQVRGEYEGVPGHEAVTSLPRDRRVTQRRSSCVTQAAAPASCPASHCVCSLRRGPGPLSSPPPQSPHRDITLIKINGDIGMLYFLSASILLEN